MALPIHPTHGKREMLTSQLIPISRSNCSFWSSYVSWPYRLARPIQQEDEQ